MRDFTDALDARLRDLAGDPELSAPRKWWRTRLMAAMVAFAILLTAGVAAGISGAL